MGLPEEDNMRTILNIVSVFLLFHLLACDDEPVNEALLMQNPIIVDGDWALNKVYQNELDITDRIGLNTFMLTLNYDGDQPSTFSITTDKRYPFIMGETSGAWTFDNNSFPNAMHFVTGDTATTELATPLFPENNSSLRLAFNLGCSDNNYVFVFGKEATE